MEKLYIKPIDHVHMFVTGDQSTEMELRDQFTFMVPGYKFTPAYKKGIWDGSIKAYNINTKRMHIGLIDQLQQFCESRKIQCEFVEPLVVPEFTEEYVTEWLSKQKFYLNGEEIALRDYQEISFINAIVQKRITVVLPTSAGKSLMLYCIAKFLMEHGKKILIQTPSIMLVEQLKDDFDQYFGAPVDWAQKVSGQYSKEITHPVCISTWQSQHSKTKKDNKPAYFNQFDAVIVDECHQCKALALSGMMEACTQVEYRIGCTGTLEKAQANKLTILGLFGPENKFISTKDLMDRGQVAKLKIKILELQHPLEVCKVVNKRETTYVEEIDAIVESEKRLRFVCNLALNLPGNTLILANYVERHIVPMYDFLVERKDEVYTIHGSVDRDEREEIKSIVKQSSNRTTLHFGSLKISCNNQDPVPLSSGEIKLAADVTEEDDVLDEWIYSRTSQASTKAK